VIVLLKVKARLRARLKREKQSSGRFHLHHAEAVRIYCNGFAGVPGFTPECFLACAINSRTLVFPS